MGRADVLFKFLQLVGKNRASDLDDYLKQVDPQDQRPIAEQLVDLIIAGDQEGYEKYNQARKEINPESEHIERGAAKEILPTFLDKWMEMERKVRAIADSKLGGSPRPLSRSLLRKLEIFSDADLKIIDSIQGLRNQIVHGTGARQSDIIEAEKHILRLLSSLEGQYSIAPRATPRRSSVRLKGGFKGS